MFSFLFSARFHHRGSLVETMPKAYSSLPRFCVVFLFTSIIIALLRGFVNGAGLPNLPGILPHGQGKIHKAFRIKGFLLPAALARSLGKGRRPLLQALIIAAGHRRINAVGLRHAHRLAAEQLHLAHAARVKVAAE